jgi:hypothetical protein
MQTELHAEHGHRHPRRGKQLARVGSMSVVTPTESAEANRRESHGLSLPTGGRNGLRCQLKFDEHAGELDRESLGWNRRIAPMSIQSVRRTCTEDERREP